MGISLAQPDKKSSQKSATDMTQEGAISVHFPPERLEPLIIIKEGSSATPILGAALRFTLKAALKSLASHLND